MVIVAATQNQHKLHELSDILADCGFEVISRDAAGVPDFDIDEDGATFEENSLKKAKVIMAACGLPAVADDSGLMVDCLNGAPGVYSARFADVYGDGADAANNKKLLELMEKVPENQRTGRFVSVVALVFPDGREYIARGECEGRIGREGKGSGGFGYDPLFTPEGFDETFAQLPQETKNLISHRAKALAKLREMLG